MNPQLLKIGENEIYISCISYEERSLAILDFIDSNNKFKKAIIFINEDVVNLETVKIKLSQLEHKYSLHFKEFCLIEIPKRFSIQKIGMYMRDKLQKSLISQEIDLISIDITTFKRFELIFLIHFIQSWEKKIRFFYTVPKNYGEWLSEEFNESKTLPILMNKQYDNRKEPFLFIILGYEMIRALKLIDDLFPKKVIFARSNPPTSEKHGIIHDDKIDNSLKFLFNDFIQEQVLDVHGYDLELFNTEICKLLDNYSKNYNIFISSMGPKCHILSLYQLYKEKKNFNFYYNTALIYNYKLYTTGIEKIFEYLYSESFEYLGFKEYNVEK